MLNNQANICFRGEIYQPVKDAFVNLKRENSLSLVSQIFLSSGYFLMRYFFVYDASGYLVSDLIFHEGLDSMLEIIKNPEI